MNFSLQENRIRNKKIKMNYDFEEVIEMKVNYEKNLREKDEEIKNLKEQLKFELKNKEEEMTKKFNFRFENELKKKEEEKENLRQQLGYALKKKEEEMTEKFKQQLKFELKNKEEEMTKKFNFRFENELKKKEEEKEHLRQQLGYALKKKEEEMTEKFIQFENELKKKEGQMSIISILERKVHDKNQNKKLDVQEGDQNQREKFLTHLYEFRKFNFKISSIIDSNHYDLLNQWMVPFSDARLLYKGTSHGFSSSSFHIHCDNQGPTITFIKTTLGWIFGGYTPIQWCSKQDFSYHPSTFLFSLENPEGTPIKLTNDGPNASNRHSIFDHSSFGPTFGGGHDLYNCNSNTISYSNLGHSFRGPPYQYGSTQAKKFLSGNYNFQVSEIEVWKIAF